MTSKRYPWFRGAWTAVAFTMAVAGATALLFRNPSVATTETVGFVFLVFVTLAAFFGNGASSIAVSLVATLCFDYFFLPPAGTLDIASPADWISLGAFLLIAVTIGRLTASAASAKESNRKLMDEMGLLAALGRPLASPADLTLTAIAEEVVSVGHFPYCSLHVYRGGRWDHAVGSARAGVAARVEEKLLQKDSPLDWTVMVTENDLGVRYLPIRNETETFAVLAVQDDKATMEFLRAVASLVGARISTTASTA